MTMAEGGSSGDNDIFVLFVEKSDTLSKLRNNSDDDDDDEHQLDKQEVAAQLRAAYKRAREGWAGESEEAKTFILLGSLPASTSTLLFEKHAIRRKCIATELLRFVQDNEPLFIVANTNEDFVGNQEQCLDRSSSMHGPEKSRGSLLDTLSLLTANEKDGYGGGDGDSSAVVSTVHTSPYNDSIGIGGESFLGHGGSVMSVLSECTEFTTDSVSPMESRLRKCAMELLQNPPVGESRSRMILQSLLNVFNNVTLGATQHHTSLENIVNAKKATVHYALPAITHVMKLYKCSARLQSRSMLILGHLGEGNPDHQDAIADVHGVSFIMAVLLHSSHSKSNTLCLEACGSMVKICANSPRNTSQLIGDDGISVLRSIMRYHSKQVGIQEQVLALLGNVAYQPNPPNNRTLLLNQQNNGETTYNPYHFLPILEDPELIEICLAIMAKHKKSKEVLQKGSRLIYLLATQGTPRTQNSLVWSKAVPVTLKVLKTFPESPVTQLEGLEALLCMALERPESRGVLAEEGCAILLESMTGHQTNPHIQDRACKIFGILCQESAYSTYVAKCLKNTPSYRNTLKDTKEAFPDKCGYNVGVVLQCYNQVYEQK
jgi:hypothetical protein